LFVSRNQATGSEQRTVPAAVASRSTLDLISLAARRGEADLRALAALARGEEIEAETSDGLVRAGLLRSRSGRVRLPAQLIAPVLALEAALGLAGDSALGELLALLKQASTRNARDTLLEALAEQLHAALAELGNGSELPDAASMRVLLDDLTATVAQLSSEDADPAYATRVAELCALLVERIAERLTGKRRRAEAKRTPDLPLHLLAAAVAGMPVALTRPLTLPSSAALARALAGPQAQPLAATRKIVMFEDETPQRRESVRSALEDDAPLERLYHGVGVDEALGRHACLVGLGRSALTEAARLPSALRRSGPSPLAWSTELVADTAVRATAAAA
jgi:hypothetical protein